MELVAAEGLAEFGDDLSRGQIDEGVAAVGVVDQVLRQIEEIIPGILREPVRRESLLGGILGKQQLAEMLN